MYSINFSMKGVYLSTFTLTSIAIDRFYVIFNPLKTRMKLESCILILSLIWIFSCVLSFPFGYFMEVKVIDIENNNRTAIICYETWPTDNIR